MPWCLCAFGCAERMGHATHAEARRLQGCAHQCSWPWLKANAFLCLATSYILHCHKTSSYIPPPPPVSTYRPVLHNPCASCLARECSRRVCDIVTVLTIQDYCQSHMSRCHAKRVGLESLTRQIGVIVKRNENMNAHLEQRPKEHRLSSLDSPEQHRQNDAIIAVTKCKDAVDLSCEITHHGAHESALCQTSAQPYAVPDEHVFAQFKGQFVYSNS